MVIINNNLAQLIKDLRQSIGISQRELAEGVCSQSEISQIENGKIIPCIYTLMSISERLGVEPVYFIDRMNKDEYTLLINIKKEIRDCSHNKNYIKMSKLIKKYEGLACFRPLEEKQFIIWHKGIVEYYVNNDPILAQQYLNYALSLRHSFYKTSQDVNILNSSAIMYAEVGDHHQAIGAFKEAISLYELSDTIADFKLHIKLLYNISKSYTKNGEWTIAEKYCDLGIKKCKKEYTFYLYGELFYQKALISKLKGDYKEASKQFNKSLFIFTESKRENYIKATLNQLEEM
ncbi:helix-turn-helix domain-containing protein [Cytobacillus horneckiae]|uniref:XRE family transcriptional regulator n=1 Tax=Cytobacillus horneckiae TaxID=549687 RepID=A0A2N0ZN92_9BACI|nr:helix-turn-helix domain-containing protein [Cytobacillus horneckiae]MEC1154872.1 helix-turn-helix domain-containing protein [Cytobacillus horneckiae]MED2936222.1 helix-turn-helix domain-containing protein [Cytobacillus horneckiae]PKG30989.1 XRE family transcriptional regulator [Cytobacillus horneckiae]